MSVGSLQDYLTQGLLDEESAAVTPPVSDSGCVSGARSFYPIGIGPPLNLLPFGLGTYPVTPLRPFKETATVYTAAMFTDDLLNVLPGGLFAVADCVPVNIHRGTPRSRDDALAIGIENLQTADAFFPPEFGDLLTNRLVIKDERAAFWVIRNVTTRTRFAQTAHTRALLTYLNVTPDGA